MVPRFLCLCSEHSYSFFNPFTSFSKQIINYSVCSNFFENLLKSFHASNLNTLNRTYTRGLKSTNLNFTLE